MKNKRQNSLFTASAIFPDFPVFPGSEPILHAGQNLWLTVKFFKKIICSNKPPYKKIKSQWSAE